MATAPVSAAGHSPRRPRRNLYRRYVWFAFAVCALVVGIQAPLLFFLVGRATPLALLAACAPLALRVRYLRRPGPPPAWFESWVMRPYFAWVATASYFAFAGPLLSLATDRAWARL